MLGRIGSALALASVATLMVVGCTPEEPVESTPPPSSVEPSPSALLTEQQVLGDAFAAVQQFYLLIDEGFAAGELANEELERVATADAIAKVQSELEQFRAMQWTIEGTSDLDTPTLVRWDHQSDASGSVELLACLDTSEVETMNADGEPVTGGTARQPRLFSLRYDASGMKVTDLAPVDPATELAGCGS